MEPASWGKATWTLAYQRPPSGENKGPKKGSRSEGRPPQKWEGVYGTDTDHPARPVSTTEAATLETVLPLQRTSCLAWGYQREWMLGRVCVCGSLPYHAWPWPLGHTLYGDPAVPLMTGHCKAWDQGAGLPAMRPTRWLLPGHWNILTPDHGKVKVGGVGREGMSRARMGQGRAMWPSLSEQEEAVLAQLPEGRLSGAPKHKRAMK